MMSDFFANFLTDLPTYAQIGHHLWMPTYTVLKALQIELIVIIHIRVIQNDF